jgi:hypothetical protein
MIFHTNRDLFMMRIHGWQHMMLNLYPQVVLRISSDLEGGRGFRSIGGDLFGAGAGVQRAPAFLEATSRRLQPERRGGNTPVPFSTDTREVLPIGRVFHRSILEDQHSRTMYERTRSQEQIKTIQRMIASTRRVEEGVHRTIELVQKREHHPQQPLQSNDQHTPRQAETLTAAAKAPQPNTTVPPLSLDQVTEQVMRQIDRRLVAWRERTGRV